MVKNADFIGLQATNPKKFQNYDISDISLFAKRETVPLRGHISGHG